MLARILGHLRAQWAGVLALFLVLAGGVAYAANRRLRLGSRLGLQPGGFEGFVEVVVTAR